MIRFNLQNVRKQELLNRINKYHYAKGILLMITAIVTTNLLAQEQLEQIVDINLGLYVCDSRLSEKSIGEDFGFDCLYRTDGTGNDIEIMSVVFDQDIFIKDHKAECIKRISVVKYIYNAIEAIPVSETDVSSRNEENWLWGISPAYEEGYLPGFLDQTLHFNSPLRNKQIAYLKKNLLFHVNVIDKGMFDDNENTKGVTMCYWKYGHGIDNPYIQQY